MWPLESITYAQKADIYLLADAVTGLMYVVKILRSTNKVEKCPLLLNGSILAVRVIAR